LTSYLLVITSRNVLPLIEYVTRCQLLLRNDVLLFSEPKFDIFLDLPALGTRNSVFLL